jgi:UDP-glucose 4-epimerase
MKKILVTGSSGFIGKSLINFEQDKYEIISSNFDICDIDSVRSSLKQIRPDYIIHLAAQTNIRDSIKDPIQNANVNIIGSLNLLESCKDLGIKKIIYTSSLIKYGEYDDIVNESFPPKPISPYGISKVAVEYYLEYYNKQYGLDYLTICLGNVFGKYDAVEKNRIVTTIINKIIKDETLIIYGDGKQTRDFVYIDDLCSIILDNIERKTEHKLYNISSHQYNILEVINKVEKISGKKLKVEFREFIGAEMKNIKLDCSLAKKELIWKQETDFDIALKEVYERFLYD